MKPLNCTYNVYVYMYILIEGGWTSRATMSNIVVTGLMCQFKFKLSLNNITFSVPWWLLPQLQCWGATCGYHVGQCRYRTVPSSQNILLGSNDLEISSAFQKHQWPENVQSHKAKQVHLRLRSQKLLWGGWKLLIATEAMNKSAFEGSFHSKNPTLKNS